MLVTGEAQSGERHGLAFLKATHPEAVFGCAASAAPSDVKEAIQPL